MGALLDLPLIDHVIVGRAEEDPAGMGFYSFREAGLLLGKESHAAAFVSTFKTAIDGKPFGDLDAELRAVAADVLNGPKISRVFSARPGRAVEVGMTSDPIFKTSEKLAAAVGLSPWTICAIRKTARMEGQPFPKYASASDVRSWLRSHPNFSARKAFMPKRPSPEAS